MMRRLAKSVIRLSWASSLYGAERLAGVLRPSRPWADGRPEYPRRNGHDGARRSGARSAATLTWETQAQLSELFQAAFQAGDHIQQGWVDLCADLFVPSRFSRAAGELAERSRGVLDLTLPGAAGEAARQELRNKFEVYWLVKGARQVLALPPVGEPFSLPRFVERAYRLDAYRALWAIEGLGHDYGVTFLMRDEAPRGILTDPAFDALPRTAQPMLHAGLGLAFAEYLLDHAAPHDPPPVIRRLIERHVALCRDNSRPEHLDTALESFGLETRCFFPEMVAPVAEQLSALADPALRRYFWHGAGRAMYFAPVSFVPGYSSIHHALQLAADEPTDETARRHALAGVAYAFAMVNMSHPRILEQLLAERGETLRDTAFVDGLVAAVAMRSEITPDAPVLRAFLDHHPGPQTAALWEETVRRPCAAALVGDRGAGLAEVYHGLPHGRPGGSGR